MVERFLARVGTLGAILILALAVLVVGFGGGVVEHFRLAATQSEQQGDQQGDQSGAQGESQQGQKGKTGSQQEDESGTQGESEVRDNATEAGQKGEQGEQGDHQTGAK